MLSQIYLGDIAVEVVQKDIKLPGRLPRAVAPRPLPLSQDVHDAPPNRGACEAAARDVSERFT
jgi:hypothetical protein